MTDGSTKISEVLGTPQVEFDGDRNAAIDSPSRLAESKPRQLREATDGA